MILKSQNLDYKSKNSHRLAMSVLSKLKLILFLILYISQSVILIRSHSSVIPFMLWNLCFPILPLELSQIYHPMVFFFCRTGVYRLEKRVLNESPKFSICPVHFTCQTCIKGSSRSGLS